MEFLLLGEPYKRTGLCLVLQSILKKTFLGCWVPPSNIVANSPKLEQCLEDFHPKAYPHKVIFVFEKVQLHFEDFVIEAKDLEEVDLTVVIKKLYIFLQKKTLYSSILQHVVSTRFRKFQRSSRAIILFLLRLFCNLCMILM